MENSLLGSLFSKTAYSKQLIYAKQFIRISSEKEQLIQNILFMENNSLGSLFQKQLIYAKQLLRISFYKKTAYSKHLIYEKTTY